MDTKRNNNNRLQLSHQIQTLSVIERVILSNTEEPLVCQLIMEKDQPITMEEEFSILIQQEQQQQQYLRQSVHQSAMACRILLWLIYLSLTFFCG